MPPCLHLRHRTFVHMFNICWAIHLKQKSAKHPPFLHPPWPQVPPSFSVLDDPSSLLLGTLPGPHSRSSTLICSGSCGIMEHSRGGAAGGARSVTLGGVVSAPAVPLSDLSPPRAPVRPGTQVIDGWHAPISAIRRQI